MKRYAVIVIDPGHGGRRNKDPSKWTTTKCKQCDEKFEVRKREIEKGKGKFCSISCGTTFRNLTNNPAKCPKVRKKISENHANVSGKNNPMYGRRGKSAPGYIDGRNSFKGESYRKKALANFEHECVLCGEDNLEELHVHHKDGNRNNNKLKNLAILCVKCHLTKVHNYERDERGFFIGASLNEEVVV